MSSLEDDMIDLEVRDSWWEQGEAVMREMTEDDVEVANKTAELIKKSGFDKTLKELEKDD